MSTRIRNASLVCAALALLLRCAVFAASYSLTDLGTLGGSKAGAPFINESGQLAGTSQTVDNDPTTQHAFRWDRVNGMQDLGTLGGRSSSATGMNEAGQVVGTSLLSGNTTQHAFLFDTSLHDLGTLGDSSDQSSSVAISNSGVVIGQSTVTVGSAFESHAFAWDSVHGMQDVGTLGFGLSQPLAVNESGQVTGQAPIEPFEAGGTQHAFVWDVAHGIQDLGSPLGGYSVGLMINSSGQVAGLSSPPDHAFDNHAVLWDPVTGAHDLGTLGGVRSRPFLLEEDGTVIGSSDDAGGIGHLVIWDGAGVHDLGSLGGPIYDIRGRDASGRIAGSCYLADWSIIHGFVADLAHGIQDLTPGYPATSAAEGINASGLIVGVVHNEAETELHAAVWDADGLHDLGLLAGLNTALVHLNDSGLAVGFTSNPGSTIVHPIIMPPASADTTPPVLTLPADVTVQAPNQSGSVVTFTVTANDDTDGPVPVNCSPPSDSAFAVGTTTVNCSATDAHSNTATGAFHVNVLFSFSGVGQPINPDGSSIFKLGSVVPIKFTLTGASAGVTDLVARLYVAKISNNVIGTETEATTNVQASNGNEFRYDAATGQYIFNWSTKGLTSGTYQLRIDLGDGAQHLAIVSLK